MAELTKEWLKQTIAEYEANRDELPFGLDTNSAIELQAFKLALASLEAEPVVWKATFTQIDNEYNTFTTMYSDKAEVERWVRLHKACDFRADITPLYTAKPVPVVPAALPENDDEDGHDIDYLEPSEVYALGRTAGWNACRAAMLQGKSEQPRNAQQNIPENIPCGNSPGTPDSWISCSERTPNDAQWCVVNTKYGYYVQCWSEGQGWLGDDISIPECDVINWMPLPEPPQEMK